MRIIKHFIEFLVVKIFFTLFRCVSIDTASNIGGFIGRNVGVYLPVSKIAYNNIKMTFTCLDDREIKDIIFKMWDNLGRVFGEFPHIYNLSKEEFGKRVEVQGIENLNYIKDNQNSGIFFSAHMANWEITPRIPIEHNMNLALIYRAANNKRVDQVICKERNKYGIQLITKGAKMAKQIIASLKTGNAIAMLVDQKMNDGIKVPLLGYNAMTPTAIAKLALKFNCPIIPAQVIRKKGAYFTVKIFSPLEIKVSNNNSQDIFNIMYNINNILSTWITEYPEQWFWVHKRWGNI
ncbi:lipid A biosynthesis lauroyl acyltransferase [Rickettsiales bacterium Ac37b]|nr:lipid A biosynthesis lauroyl acyltransferase [Rickettsiales bacterium Ac37b]